MCIHIERAHLQTLFKSYDKKIAKLKDNATSGVSDPMFSVDDVDIATPALVVRDFPKNHGYMIQDAIKLALMNHHGGYTETEKKFTFLSGLSVSVDNFFVDRHGQIWLFETKRTHGSIREEGTAPKNLLDVAKAIEASAKKLGKRLRFPIKFLYFSFYPPGNRKASKPNRVNIGSKAEPKYVDMPIYYRKDMNKLIGTCFGDFLAFIDAVISYKLAISLDNERIKINVKKNDHNLIIGKLNSGDKNGPVLFGDEYCEPDYSLQSILKP